MEVAICPFCWDEDVRLIEHVKVVNQKITRVLMECNSCEKYYWEDDGKEFKNLSDFCETLHSEPEKCDEDIRNAKMSKNPNHDRRKMEEFDLLCGICSNRKFLLNNNKTTP